MSGMVLLDTSGWLALVNERLTEHRAAVQAYEDVLRTGGHFVTTDLVVAEMHALTVRHRGAAPALRLLDDLRRDPTHDVRYPDRDMQEGAVERWMKQTDIGPITLAQAVSLELMRREGIQTAIATDAVFRRAGFGMVPGAPGS